MITFNKFMKNLMELVLQKKKGYLPLHEAYICSSQSSNKYEIKNSP